MVTVKVTHKVHKRWQTVKPGAVKIGFPRGTDSDVLNRAFWNNYGTERIPPRPFMQLSLQRHIDTYKRFFRTHLSDVTFYQDTREQLLSKLGLIGQKHIQREIVILTEPPNAPATIARKGSSNPLVDTSEMGQSVTFQVIGLKSRRQIR